MSAELMIEEFEGTLTDLKKYYAGLQEELKEQFVELMREEFEFWTDEDEDAEFDDEAVEFTYTGTFASLPEGLKIVSPVNVSSKEEAEKYIEDNHSKWDSALAIEVGGKWIFGGWCPA